MKKLLALLSLVSHAAIAAEYKLIEPRDVYIDIYEYGGVYDSYLSPLDRKISHGANFVTNFDILKVNGWGLYSLNKLHFDGSNSTGRIVHGGWEYEQGLTLFPIKGKEYGKVEVFWQHHSRHVFDHERPDEHFPLYDRYGVRLRVWP